MGDVRAWVQAHGVCWEIEPLREFIKGHGVQQTGYELRLFGHLDLRAQAEVEQAARRVHDALREIALGVLAAHPEPHAVITVQPFDRAVHLRPESSFSAEVELAVVACPRHPADPLPADEAQRRIAAIEEALRSLGIHRCALTTLTEFARSHTLTRA